MKTKKRSKLFAIAMCTFFLLIGGCMNVKENTKEINSLFAELGDISMVTEAEIDLVYTVESKEAIESIKDMLIEAVVSEEIPGEDDALEIPPGAPDYASALRFHTTEGKELSVYVNDPDLSYDMVCHFYTSPTEETCYCYSLKKSIYKDIKKITHAGKMTDLNNQ